MDGNGVVSQPNGNGKKKLGGATGKGWLPGQSGNPKGGPRKDVLTSVLKAEIEKICPQDKEGRTWKELVALATIRLAIQGNGVAIKEVWNRLDGQVKQRIEHTGDDSNPIAIEGTQAVERVASLLSRYLVTGNGKNS